ncbi:MAG: hypothetical protein ACFFDN_16915 [Candidatus Hodarchaeota archaeon]
MNISDIGIEDFPNQSLYNFTKKSVELESIKSSDNATQLNGSIESLYEIKIYKFDAFIITFNYTDANTNATIENASANYTWYDKNNVSSYGNGTLIELGSGLYTLDFNTSSRDIGEYVINIHIKNESYTEPNMVILLSIEKRPTRFLTLTGTTIKFERGAPLILLFFLEDSQNSTDLDGLSIQWIMGFLTGKLISLSNGIYTLLIPPVEFEIGTHLLILDGSDNVNHKIALSTVMLEITWEKILGIDAPIFYAVIIIVITLGVGILIYKLMQRAKIPFVIKKIDESLNKVETQFRPISTAGIRSREKMYEELFEKEFKLIGKKPKYRPLKTKDDIQNESK